jgi:hypothetical protein
MTHTYINTVDGFDRFKDDTATVKGMVNKKVKLRGGQLRVVDVALEAVLEGMSEGAADWIVCSRLANLLKEVKAAIRELTEKMRKTFVIKAFFSGGQRERRLKSLQVLKREALAELCRRDPGVALALALFQRNKNRNSFIGKTLDPHYSGERDSYLASNKTKAVSMNNFIDSAYEVQAILRRNGIHTAEDKLADKAMQRFPQPDENDNLKQIQAKELQWIESLSENEFQAVFEVADRNAPARMQTQVMMLDKMSRLRKMVNMMQGKVQDIYMQDISTTPRRSSGLMMEWMWAMDLYGNFFISDDLTAELQQAQDRRRFNHSSFMAGGEILCAGMLCVDAGQLLLITNGSGHYKPSVSLLRAAVQVLADEGIDLSQTCVGRVDGSQGSAPSSHCMAADFLQNENCPDDKSSPYARTTSRF